MAANADLSRIAIRDREAGPLDLSTPAGMAALTGQAAAMTAVRLVVLSPLLAFFGRAGATDDAIVRGRLAALLQWAAQNRIAVLGLMHPAKNPGKSLDGQFAGADAYRRAARSAFVAMPDASDPEPIEKRKRRVLVCAGVNGAADDFRLFYRIEGCDLGAGRSTSRIVWLPAPASDAEPERQTERCAAPQTVAAESQNVTQIFPIRRAEKWALARLPGAGPVSFSVLMSEITPPVSDSTLRRALRNIGATETSGATPFEPATWELKE